MKATTLALTAWALLEVGCRTGAPTMSTLKSTYEEFEQRARWGDSAALGQIVVPERRAAFLAARGRDASDLSVTEVDLLDVNLSQEGTRATVTSRMHWLRLPSASEQVENVRSEWVARGEQWLLESMQGGPYPDLAPRK
jgi:hypothetical protein